MDTAHGNATPANGLWGVLKQIVTVNGFFGPGFWQDFKEGWQEATAKQAAAPSAAYDDEDEAVNINLFEEDYDDPYGLGGGYNRYWKPHDPGSDYDPFDADMIANSCIHPDSNLW